MAAFVAALLMCGAAYAAELDSFEAEEMTLSGGKISVVANEPTASGTKYVRYTGPSTATKTTAATTQGDSLIVRARGVLYKGLGGQMYVTVKGQEVYRARVNHADFRDIVIPAQVQPGANVVIGGTLLGTGREIHVDKVSVTGPLTDADADADGVPDGNDNCPNAANPAQNDTDADGTGDACDAQDNRDTDGDGVQNHADNCPNEAGPASNNGCPVSPPPPSGLGLAIQGNQFLMDGQPFDMYGVRVASASQSEELTNMLIANLDEYKAHGVNTIAVFYMGSLNSNSDPFEPDGNGGVRLESDDAERMRRIIEAADDRNMAVIVGIFYQRAPYTDVNTDAKVVDAIDAVVDDLVAYDNIVINIANEQNSAAYDTLGAPGNFRDPLQINDYITQVKTRDPNRLIGGGGYDNAKNIIIGQHEHTDVLLFDTGGYDTDSEHSGSRYDYYRQQNVPDKPMADVEMFGGYTGTLACQPTAGVYTDACKQKHFTSTQDAISRPGLSVFFHSSKWIQGGQPRYHLGGYGTSAEGDAGMRWWFEYVRDHSIQ